MPIRHAAGTFRRLGMILVSLPVTALLHGACDRSRQANAAAPLHDAGVSVTYFGKVECVATRGNADPKAPRPLTGMKVCGPVDSASVTRWKWTRQVDGSDEYEFTHALTTTEGAPGAVLEQTESGPLWLGPKESRTVRFRGDPVVVFENEAHQVVLHVPEQSGS